MASRRRSETPQTQTDFLFRETVVDPKDEQTAFGEVRKDGRPVFVETNDGLRYVITASEQGISVDGLVAARARHGGRPHRTQVGTEELVDLSWPDTAKSTQIAVEETPR